MTSGINFTGLASGLDTSSIISQLMTLAAQPQAQLRSQLSHAQQVENGYQSVVGGLNAVASSLVALGASSASTSAALSAGSTSWSALKVDSSSSAVAASAGSTATAGTSLTFDVQALAKAQVLTVATTNGVAASGTGIDITTGDGVTHHIALSDGTNPPDGSNAAVAAAINAAGLAVRASVLTTDQGTVLQLTGTKTGAANAFTVSGFDDPAPRTVVAAQDARIAVGDPATTGYTVSSSTNTFTGLASGVTLSVNALATGVTLDVAADTDAVAAGVSHAVDNLNAVLGTLGGLTGKGALLQSDSTVNTIAQSILSAVSGGTVGKSYADYGVSLTSTGTLSFDKDKFLAAYQADPQDAQATVGTLAQSLSDVTDRLIDPVTGSLTLGVQSSDTQQADLTTRISDWDTKLADQQQRLQLKFQAMETAIAKLNSQGTYLKSVLDSVNSSSSKSS